MISKDKNMTANELFNKVKKYMDDGCNSEHHLVCSFCFGFGGDTTTDKPCGREEREKHKVFVEVDVNGKKMKFPVENLIFEK